MTGIVGTGNSTDVVLGAGETYTGKSDIVKDYASASVVLYSDVASAAGGVQLQFSPDGASWFDVRRFTLPAGEFKELRLDMSAYRFRVVFTNGSAAQSSFFIQTIYHQFAVSEELRDFNTQVGRGEITGWSSLVLRAHNTDVDAAAAEDLVEWGGSVQYPSAAEACSIVSTSANDAAAGTHLRAVLVEGVDGSNNPISEVVSLAGLTPVSLANQYLRINQMTGVSVGTAGNTNDGAITITGDSSGYTLNSIAAGDGISHNGIYRVPAGTRVTFGGADITIVKPGGSSPTVTVRIFVRTSPTSPWLNLFDTTIDTAVQNFITFNSPNRASFGAGVDARIEAETSNDNTDVRARLYLLRGPSE